MCSRQVLTRGWWDIERSKYALVVSEPSRSDESEGTLKWRRCSSARVARGGAFPLDQEILELARVLMLPALIPKWLARRGVYRGGLSREV